MEDLGDRLMFRLAYRNFGDHEALVVAQNVTPGAGSAAQSAMRWYELRATPAGASFALYQSGTYQDKTNSLWMGSAAMDKLGNMALGMSVAGSARDPGVWYTGRLAGDPLGQLEAPRVAAKGSAVETGDSARWGDYSSMVIDPATIAPSGTARCITTRNMAGRRAATGTPASSRSNSTTASEMIDQQGVLMKAVSIISRTRTALPICAPELRFMSRYSENTFNTPYFEHTHICI